MVMRPAHLALLSLIACGGQSPEPSALAAQRPATPATTESAREPATAGRALQTFPRPWDPAQPVELDTLSTRTLFVTREASAICPTREGAEARSCGNSVEFSNEGLALSRGEEVTIVGDEPFDGHWRAIRYQLDGLLPSWIRADDVAGAPDLSERRRFEQREDFAAARDIDSMSPRAVGRLPAGTLVRFTARRDIRFAAMARVGALDLEGATMVYVPAGRQFVGVGLLETSDMLGPELWPWARHHPCIADGDCLSLSYRCDEGSGEDNSAYCDEVSILAFVTPTVTAPPADPEGEWPAVAQDDIPFLVGLALADRFGVHAFRVPASMQHWRRPAANDG